jgi:hypothetical protein
MYNGMNYEVSSKEKKRRKYRFGLDRGKRKVAITLQLVSSSLVVLGGRKEGRKEGRNGWVKGKRSTGKVRRFEK